MKKLTVAKNTTSFKLKLYFTISLLVFSILVGIIFTVIFRNYTVSMNRQDMENRANSIAENMSGYLTHNRAKSGYGAYLRFVEDIAGTNVWIIDDEYNLITGGYGKQNKEKITYSDIPKNADLLIQEAFEGEMVFSEDFSSLFGEMMLTICTPILTETGDVVGVVLLHSSVEGLNNAVYKGVLIMLLSILFSLLIVLIMSNYMTNLIIKPLNKINNMILRLSNGDYGTRVLIESDNEIGQLGDALNIMSERLEKASAESENLQKLRNDFIVNISHELRTPVTVIRGTLEAIVDEVITEPTTVAEYQRQALNEVEFLQRLVSDLLEISKLQNVDFEIVKSKVYIADVLDDVTRSARQLANKKNVSILCSSENCKIEIDGDYGRLRQMFIIILDNAIKFSPSASEIEILIKDNIIEIIDEGNGIPIDELSDIFQRFYKSRNENNRTGTGLGLAIAKEISLRHGVNLYAENSEKKGAKFVMEF